MCEVELTCSSAFVLFVWSKRKPIHGIAVAVSAAHSAGNGNRELPALHSLMVGVQRCASSVSIRNAIAVESDTSGSTHCQKNNPNVKGTLYDRVWYCNGTAACKDACKDAK